MVKELEHTELGDIPADWGIQTFEETFKVLSNNTLSRDNLNYRGGAVRNIHYGDILIKFPEVLNCEKDEIPYVNDISLLTSSTQLLQDGDIVIADTAEDDAVGKVTEVQHLADKKLVAGLHTIPCRVKKGDFAPGWLGYYMNSHMYHDQILPFVTGIKVSSISKSAIAETLILIPPKEEQERIVNILNDMEQCIYSNKSMLEKYKKIREGQIQALISCKKGTDSKIRISGYTRPWKNYRVGDMFSVTRGYVLAATTLENNKSSDAPYPVYSSQTKENGLLGFYKDYLYEDAITWTTDGANAGTVKYRAGKFYCTNVCGVLLSDKEKATKMIAESLNAVSKGYVSYVGNPKLMNNVMADIEIRIPQDTKEREEISEYLLIIDEQIETLLDKIKKYQFVKSGAISELITGKIRLV